MEDRLLQQDEKITIGLRKITELTQTIEELKERVQRHENHSKSVTTPATQPPPTAVPTTLSNDSSRHADAGFTPVRRGVKRSDP